MLTIFTVAISLIPYTYHARVIASACRMKVDVVTTSYVSPAMQELEPKIKEAGICVMNEIGKDFCFSPFSSSIRADAFFYQGLIQG